MAGTKAGAKKAVATIKAKHGADFYKKIGSKSQKSYTAKPKEERKPRGFASMDEEVIREVGRRGGTISRRGVSSSSVDYEAYLRRVRAYALKNQAKAQGEA